MKSLRKIVSGILILSSLITPQKVISQMNGIYIPKYVFIYLNENNEIENVTKNNSGCIYDSDQTILIVNKQGEMLPCSSEIKYKLNKFNCKRNEKLNETEIKIADQICKDIDFPLTSIEDTLSQYKVPSDFLKRLYQIKIEIDGDTNYKNIKNIEYKLKT